MDAVNVHQAKTHLSRMLARTQKGESFVIAKAGKPVTKLVPINTPEPGQIKRLGFMSGAIQVPEDFDDMGRGLIERWFSGE